MLEIRHVYKTYEGMPLLNDISLTLTEGETVCLLGASGSGKSTLLRIVAGLEESDAGSILFNSIDLTSTPPHLRDFGLVFQDYALFPHLNVNDNVAFPNRPQLESGAHGTDGKLIEGGFLGYLCHIFSSGDWCTYRGNHVRGTG
jgi:ABC-type Fe3+/spermidine/putrescine transport system ATPase subunit